MKNLLEIDKKNIWHPFTPLNAAQPIYIEKAKGVYLYTSDGKRIIDAVSSWWVNIHGHSNEVLAQALYEQATQLEHVIFAGFTHKPAIQLSENLLSILPANQSKIFFSDNGSTAVEVALKMALQYWYNQGSPRKKIIAIDGAYHGDTFGSMSVGERSIFTQPFNDLLFQVDFIDFPTAANEEKVLKSFKTLVDTNEVAAFIYEPLLQGASGMRMYSSKILDQLLKYAQNKNVICIADEVMTGFGRTGKLFASNHLKHQPDIMALSKGITGGTMPLGVTACSSKITEAFLDNDFSKTFFHGHSYTANPLACAVANASFSLLMSEDCKQNISRIEHKHLNFINDIRQNKHVEDARSLGTVCAIELQTTGKTSYQNELRNKIYPYFLDRGILLRPLGNVIYILPPYVITNEELEDIYNAIKDFLVSLD